jgi:hypothetical protein
MPLLRRDRATRCRDVSTSRSDQRSPRQALASSTAIGWIGLHPRVVTPSNHATTIKSGWVPNKKRIRNKGAGGNAGLLMAIVTCAIIDLVAIALFFGLCIFVCP